MKWDLYDVEILNTDLEMLTSVRVLAYGIYSAHTTALHYHELRHGKDDSLSVHVRKVPHCLPRRGRIRPPSDGHKVPDGLHSSG